jgi:hypothetical protein
MRDVRLPLRRVDQNNNETRLRPDVVRSRTTPIRVIREIRGLQFAVSVSA